MRQGLAVLEDYLAGAARRRPDQPALISAGQRLLLRDLAQRAQRLAALLWGCGVGPDDRVLVAADSTAEAMPALWAALQLGTDATLHPLASDADTNSIARVLHRCDATVVVSTSTMRAMIANMLPRCCSVRALVCAESLAAAAPLDWRERVLIMPGRTGGSSEPSPAAGFTTVLDPAGLVCTSPGQRTRFVPGPGVLSQGAAHHDNRALDRPLCVLPLSMDGGLYRMLMAFPLGVQLVLQLTHGLLVQLRHRFERSHERPSWQVPSLFGMLEPAAAASAATTTPRSAPPAGNRAPREARCGVYGLIPRRHGGCLPGDGRRHEPTQFAIDAPAAHVWLSSPLGQPVAPGQLGQLTLDCPELAHGALPGAQPSTSAVLCTADLCRMDHHGRITFVGCEAASAPLPRRRSPRRLRKRPTTASGPP